MNNKLLVVKGICESPYIDQYIIKLKNNKSLFSIEDNLWPCDEVEPGRYAFRYWDGLSILEAYAKKPELNNEMINDFIISLINSVITVITADTEEDYHKRYSSNWGNMSKIFGIISAKDVFIKEIKVLDFVKEYSSNKMNNSDTILDIMNKNKENYLSNDSSIFFAIHELFIADDIDDIYYGYLCGNSVSDFIKNAPYKYFFKSKRWIENTESIFFAMGAFEEYSQNRKYKIDKEDIFIDWFIQSSQYVNIDLIKEIIQEYFSSEKELLNKCAVFLLSIRFYEVKTLFFEKMAEIVRNHSVFSDFRVLLEKNISQMTNNEKKRIYDCLQNTEIDAKGEYISPILKNRLYMILSINGLDCAYKQESAKEKDLIENYNKILSFSRSDMEEDIKSCKSEMDGKSFKEILKDYYIENKSFYYGDVINKSVGLYIQENDINICQNAEIIPETLSISLINRMIEKKEYDDLINFIEVYIEKMPFEREILQTTLFAIRMIYENKKETAEKLLLKLDYKRIPISSIESYQISVITEIINECVFDYLNLLSEVASEDDLIKKRFFDAIEYFISIDIQGWKIKAVLGYLSQRILELNKEYYINKLDYILNNDKDNINPSYHTISWSNNYSKELLDCFVFRDDFILFFEEPDSQIEDSISIKKQMLVKVIRYYFVTGKGLDVLKRIIRLTYKYSLTSIYRQLSFDLYLEKSEEIRDKGIQRINDLVEYIEDSNFIYELEEDYNYDQLSREIAILIIRTKNCNKILWKQLLAAFKKYNRFFADEICELVKEYKISEYDNVKKLLIIYFGKYKPFFTYEETLRKVFDLIKNEPKYERDARRWRTALTKINPDLEI